MIMVGVSHDTYIWLVVSSILKNISQLGWLSPIYCGKIKKMFQTTNQYMINLSHGFVHPSPLSQGPQTQQVLPSPPETGEIPGRKYGI